jgi:hypothetical protein
MGDVFFRLCYQLQQLVCIALKTPGEVTAVPDTEFKHSFLGNQATSRQEKMPFVCECKATTLRPKLVFMRLTHMRVIQSENYFYD